jgi:hypothetical protein
VKDNFNKLKIWKVFVKNYLSDIIQVSVFLIGIMIIIWVAGRSHDN